MTNVGAMHRFAGLLRRHGLTLLLTSAMVALYLVQTIPALKERASLRDRRVAAEVELADAAPGDLGRIGGVHLCERGVECCFGSVVVDADLSALGPYLTILGGIATFAVFG